MAEVDARVARGAPAAPITATAIGKLSGLTAEPRLLATDGGLIDAFAEVFASMSRRWPAADATSGQNFGGDSRGSDSFAHRQANSRDGFDSNSDESFDAARDRRAQDQSLSQDDAEKADDWSLMNEASGAAGQPEVTIYTVAGHQQAGSDQGRSQDVTNQSGSTQDAQGNEILGLDQRRQQEELANRAFGLDRGAASLEGDEQSGDPRGTTPNAAGDASDQAARNMGSSIVEQLANRRRRNRTQPINDPNPADAKASNRGPLGALKLASGEIPVAAQAAEVSSQGMASSATSPTTIPTVPPMTAINQVQALSPTNSVAEPVPGARRAAKSLSPPLDLHPAPSQGESRSASGNTHAEPKSSADVVARIKLIQRVSKAFQHLGPEGGSVRIRLAPAELGSVRVEMQVHDRRVKARVVAETESASTALREHLSDLRTRLESYGMQVERLEVEVEMTDRGFDPRQDANSQWQSPKQQRGAGNRFTTEPPSSTRTESDRSAAVADTMANVVDAANRGVDVRL